MARTINRLSDRTYKALTEPGRHADGNGLYLSISPDGSRRRWVYLFRWKAPGETGAGKLREMGLGSANSVGLKDAREKARQARASVEQGHDPLQKKLAPQRVPTFGEMADEVVSALQAGWRNPKHAAQWRMTLATYAGAIRQIPVDAVTTKDVQGVLEPIWTKVPETAARLRARLEKVLDAAKAKGHRTGENPARWRGHLDHLLPKRKRLSRGHHKALPYNGIAGLVARLRASGSVSALCLEFTILTAARSGEALGARWEEFDLQNGVWTVSGERMKAGRDHQVPLSGRAKEIVSQMASAKIGSFVFPGLTKRAANHKGKAVPAHERGLSVMALEMVMRRMKVDATVHGFRSAFRDWAAETTEFPDRWIETALAHENKDKVEAAYLRTKYLEQRRAVMERWAAHCEPRDPLSVPVAPDQ